MSMPIDLLRNIVAPISFLATVLLVVAAFARNCTVAGWLIRLTVRRLPESVRARYTAEWLGELAHLDSGSIAKVRWAFGIWSGRSRLAAELSDERLANEEDPNLEGPAPIQ